MGASTSVAAMDDYDIAINGLFLNGKLIPEPVVEIILSCVNVRDILQMRQVCQLWRDIVSRRTFWMEVFERNAAQWDTIPQRIKQKDELWTVSYWWLNQKVMIDLNTGKNVKATDKNVTLNPPVGIDPLPEDPQYNGVIDSAFVTSYGWVELRQKISRSEVGLTPKIIELIVPFYFAFNAMIGARVDCGGHYCVTLELLDEDEETLRRSERQGEIQSGSNWTGVSFSMDVPTKSPELLKAKYLIASIRGKDNQFWQGHYGTKFSRIAVNVNLINK